MKIIEGCFGSGKQLKRGAPALPHPGALLLSTQEVVMKRQAVSGKSIGTPVSGESENRTWSHKR